MIKRKIYLKKIRPFYDSELIKVIIGVRRSGKSVLLKQIMDEIEENGIAKSNIIYINFESLVYDDISNYKEFYDYVKQKIKNKKKYYLFFDEIQNVEKFEKAINSFRVDFDVSIFITGSNSKLLSGELATLLTGRFVKFRVMPFSYKEVCELKEYEDEASNEDIFLDYLKWGGMPGRFKFNNNSETKVYLNDLFGSIIFKDIAERYKLKDLGMLSDLFAFMVENTGKTFSSKSVMNYLKNEKRDISTRTLYNYLEYMTSSLLLNKVNRYDIKGKKTLATLNKYYVTDLGLREVKKSNTELNLGFSLETIVYNELISRGYEVYIGKTNLGEIDFIATNEDRKVYIQVCYLLSTKETEEREFGAYKNITDNYPKYVISMDKFDFSRNGIIHLNAIDFFLGNDL